MKITLFVLQITSAILFGIAALLSEPHVIAILYLVSALIYSMTAGMYLGEWMDKHSGRMRDES